MISCSIVIYSWNQSVNQKVISILSNINKISRIYLIYNGTNHDSFQKLKNCFSDDKKIKIYKIKNYGMGNAHNSIINNKELNKYHLILNPDVFVNEQAIEEGLKKLDENNEIIAVGPEIFDQNNIYWPSVKLLPDPITQIIRRLNPKSKINKKYELNNFHFKKDIFVPMISGCYILSKSEVLKDIRGFDERFFLYMEDIDIIRRLSKYGKICYMPNTSVIHLNNLESRKSFKMFLIHFISYIKYYNKWGWIKDNLKKDINNKFISFMNTLK
tara:strand:+ start:1950 stop:2762 length:813 start_codon:yes stop_codon:yes gene_type:complete